MKADQIADSQQWPIDMMPDRHDGQYSSVAFMTEKEILDEHFCSFVPILFFDTCLGGFGIVKLFLKPSPNSIPWQLP